MGKRPAPSLKGTDGGTIIRPSQGAMQYGDTDDFGPTYCTAFVQDEECRILVDTGSSVTIMSERFFNKIREKVKDRIQQTTQVPYKIQGVTGHMNRPIAEVQHIPLRFDKRSGIWNLNAGI
ncbi:1265_t:CDS:1, partial [Paraglomus occultum]